jgi:transglutaminase-like putative cysteine protease
MRLERAWQLSTYLTLAMSCACLGQAELAFFRWFPFFLFPVGLLLLTAYRVEGRWTLPVWVSNVLAVVIGTGAVAGVGVLYYLQRKGVSITEIPVPWPTALVPPVGPLLLLLLLIKLFRPKRLHDWQLLHTMAFLQVALACVLAGEAAFGLALLSYVTCGLWSLALFQVRAPEETDADGRVPWRWLGLGKAARWTLAALALGLVLFLLVPRQPDTLWDSSRLAAAVRQALETGNADDVDLNTTGTVRVNHEVAFEVTAYDVQGRPKTDLDAAQLWRSQILELYDQGRWLAFKQTVRLRGNWRLPVPPAGAHRPGTPPPVIGHTNTELPDLGPGQFRLTFQVNLKQAGGLVLAEPVVLGPGKLVHPYQSLRAADANYFDPLFFERDGTLFPLPIHPAARLVYRQVTRPPAPKTAGLSRPRSLTNRALLLNGWQDNGDPLLERIRDWTRDRLRDLAGKGRFGVTGRMVPGRDGKIPDRNHRDAARALAHYLARSGDYTYSLTVKREHPHTDPTWEFLRYGHTGYCKQFAGGLALMLRSVGIPARVVRGFRGAEHEGEGRYVVRQSHAHSWVEALVPGREEGGALCWLSLDPTPAEGAEEGESDSWSLFWQRTVQKVATYWRTFLVELNPETQQEAATDLWRAAAPGQRLAAAAGWVLDSYSGPFWSKPGFWILTPPLALLVYRLARRRRAGAGGTAGGHPAAGFYLHLLAILERRCRLRPGPAQTPREFGAAARQALSDLAAPAALAELPGRVVELFYQLRYGARPVPEAERRAIERQLDELDRLLAGPPLAA